MDKEKTLDQMTPAEIRAALVVYNSQETPAPALVLPSGVSRENLKPAEEDRLSSLYVAGILSKVPSSWTPEEREAIRTDVARALREMK